MINLSDSTPTAPSGHTNVAWQKDVSGNVSANVADPPVTSVAGHTGAVTLTEADLSTSDITTNNVSITKHGFAPKAPNDSTKYLDGTGAYTIPAGSTGGTVTSVGLSTPSWLSVSSSPVTTTGTLAVTATTGQTANQFLSTPNGSTGAVTLRSIVQADLPAQPFLIVYSLAGLPPASDTFYVDIPSTLSTVAFAANLAGSVGKCGTNPTSTATYTVKQNGSTVGTISISTSGTFTFATSGGSTVTCAASDELSIIAPSSQDATLSDVRFTVVGTR